MSETEKENNKRQLDEIEIDLSQTAPLSKKQKRLLRKGKLDLSKLEQQQKEEAQRLMKSAEDGTSKESKGDGEGDGESERPKKKETKELKFGVWIGNMAFDTEKGDVIRFIASKTADLPEYSSDIGDDEPCKVTETDIARFNMPNQSQSKKIKGFAYVDFNTKNHQLAVIQLSEQQLNGRSLLIKDSKSFAGRPTKEDVEMSKNPPSRILFVGNLSFDTTQDMLTDQFQHCGEIVKIRMATFEDTGKCKGFAFIDFKNEEGPTKALKDKSCRKLLNRTLRMEFGEDRSKRAPKHINKESREPREDQEHHEPVEQHVQHDQERPIRERSMEKRPLKRKPIARKPERQKSSVALATAQRASAAVVKSTGKKTTF
jgi:RNA recognition motif-containing protein